MLRDEAARGGGVDSCGPSASRHRCQPHGDADVGDADVGGGKGRSVVNPVASLGDDSPLVPEPRHEPSLLGRQHFGHGFVDQRSATWASNLVPARLARVFRAEPSLLFVYGSLLEGERDHDLLLSAECVGPAKTPPPPSR